ncbi:MAG TPA: hypothetical protein V6C58_18255 [Allocoleopsis sp.]
MKNEIIRARVNVKSLTAEAKIIKQEIEKTDDSMQKSMLREHLVNTVRPEARLANLAIRFLKHKTRSSTERSKRPVDILRLARKINLFYHGYNLDQKWWKFSVAQITEWFLT